MDDYKSLENAISYCIENFSTQEATKRIIDYIKSDRDINEQLHQYNVGGQNEQLVCSCGYKKIKTNSGYECGNAKCSL